LKKKKFPFFLLQSHKFTSIKSRFYSYQGYEGDSNKSNDSNAADSVEDEIVEETLEDNSKGQILD
jgi:hypothetical protein